MTWRLPLAGLVCCALFLGACGDEDSGNGTGTTAPSGSEVSLPQGSEPVKLDPADFTNKVDNRYWPMAPDGKPGRAWTLRSDDERVVVKVTSKKKTVAGIEALVVNDTVTANNGELVEVTDDWYAQDKDGNVWYLGEDVKDYRNGKVVSTAGSWEHGVDGAYAGVAIPADPQPGLKYRQEYYKGEAEDAGEVLSIKERVSVPAGTFENCLQTRDTTPLEPDVVEHKYYAPGVGPARSGKPGAGGEELVSFTK
jgi:hypothetical protein